MPPFEVRLSDWSLDVCAADLTALHGTSARAAGYVIAVASVSWTVTAVRAAGATERHDPKLIATGTVVVALSVAGFAWAVPHGPVWLIALCAAMEGGGFGLAWTFILQNGRAHV